MQSDDFAMTHKANGSVMPTPIGPFLTPKLAPVQIIIFAIYPFTILLGTLSNHPTESYFSRKDNIINILFLKLAWGWTTIAFFMHLARLPQKTRPLVRYVIATVWWYLVTQWCFGAPIMDKVSPFDPFG